MTTEISKETNIEIIQRLVLDGDISRMTPAQKVSYYNSFCTSLGLNPLTQPFQILRFQGKDRLYATKDCTEQLRKIHGVSITDITTTSLNGVFIVTAKAIDKDNKQDAATGAVNIEGLKGDVLANALMKAETKAKRRVTLSICGLGMLDESEIETIPQHEVIEITTPKEPKETPSVFKPKLTDAALRKLKERILNGEVNLLEKARSAFDINVRHEEILSDAINSFNNKNKSNEEQYINY